MLIPISFRQDEMPVLLKHFQVSNRSPNETPLTLERSEEMNGGTDIPVCAGGKAAPGTDRNVCATNGLLIFSELS
jgi:hypothetical protein